MRLHIALLAGAALSLAACNDDLTDEAGIVTPAEAAVWVDFNANQGMLGKECGSAVNNHNRGIIGHVQDEIITSTARNGRDGAEIICAVVPSGAGFNISLEAHQNESHFVMTAAGVPADVSVDAPAEGASVTYESSDTPQPFGADDCRIYLIEAPQKIEAGYAHFQFTCPVVVSEDTTLGCAIAASTVLVRQCATE